MEIPILADIFKMFGLAMAVLALCTRLKVPTIVGFLVTGVLAGPYGLGLVRSAHEVEVMAEIGVVLLLFTIGIEFSLGELMKIRKRVLVGGSLQLLFTFVVALTVARLAGLSYTQGVYNGFLFSLSSTAIALRLLQQKAQVDSPHGRTSLGILIFQDIAVVPMMLAIPILAGTGGSPDEAFFRMGKGFLLVAAAFAAARWWVPRLLHRIAQTRDREFFLLTIVVICIGVAWITNEAGLSLSLGAFLAGLIISESEYSHQALGNILPFKDLFTTFFFISIGMLLDVSVIWANPLMVFLLTAGVLLAKTAVAAAATYFLGYPLRTMLLVGFTLSQVGEFSFVLAGVGVQNGLMNKESFQLFLAVSVMTMAMTPVVLAFAPRMVILANRLPLSARLRTGIGVDDAPPPSANQNHLVIIGYGLNGRNLARAAQNGGIGYDVIEMNPDVVRAERQAGVPIWYGDATQDAILEHVHVDKARVVVVAVSDPVATRRITHSVHRLNPDALLIVRTRYGTEVNALLALGASEVIPEEFETSIQIFTRVLREYDLPEGQVQAFVDEIRSDSYGVLRQYGSTQQALFRYVAGILK